MSEKPDHRAYILRILDLTGWSQTDLARRAGLDPSTLSRFLTQANDGHELRPSTLKRIETVSGVPISAPSPVAAAPDGFGESEAQPYGPSGGSDLDQAIMRLKGGATTIDAWVLHSRALELVGYRPLDILLVKLGETPLKGDVVCAQIYDWRRREAQTVFRLFEPPFLVAATTDASLVAPFDVREDHVSIKGVVMTMIRARSTT